jgi:Fe2+ transport system protein B
MVGKTLRIMEKNRKYLPTLAELIDRLSIVQLKEIKIPEHKAEYAEEISNIVHDINLILNDQDPRTLKYKAQISGEVIRAIIVLSQMNAHIWENESKVRNNTGGGNLALTHGINGIRNIAKNKIQETVGGRKDYKIDCLAAEFKDWEVSW